MRKGKNQTTQRTIDDADGGIELGHTRHHETPLVDHRRYSICSLETRLCRSRKMWKERISEEVCCYFPFAPSLAEASTLS
jgi:hypothetical protein